MDRRSLLQGLAVGAAAIPVTQAVAAEKAAASGAPPPTEVAVPGSTALEVTPLDPAYFNPGRFKGKTIVITGFARGMGRAAATRAAREGANIVGVDWLPDEARATAAAITAEGGKIAYMVGNVAKTEDCDRLVALAVEIFGGVDLALNNAGVMDGVYSGDPIDLAKQRALVFAPIDRASDEYWDNVFATNAAGVFKSMRAELRQMKAQGRGGAIVNVASIAGLTGLAGNPAYVASKHAVNGLTANAAIDFAPYGIRVNSVNMAATDTPMVARAGKLVAEINKAGNADNMGRMSRSSVTRPNGSTSAVVSVMTS